MTLDDFRTMVRNEFIVSRLKAEIEEHEGTPVAEMLRQELKEFCESDMASAD